MLALPISGWGQAIEQHCNAWSTNSHETSSHISKVQIELKQGFSIYSTSTSKFVFGYDEHTICELGEEHTIDPNDPNEFKHDTSLPVGAIAGTSGVSPSGAATYTIPIFASPGINGMEPQLSLNYNSQGGNGILGIGWSLGGLSAIRLSPNLAYNDGYFEAIKFNDNGTGKDRYQERYALDGNRLVADGNTYRTEIETFQKIEKIGTEINTSFISTTKDGTKIYYGSSENSRIILNGDKNILSWLIDTIKDVNGNYIVYEYQDYTAYLGGDIVAKEKLIKSIKYTGNANLIPFNSIKFYYGKRVDESTSYLDGTRFRQMVLLEKIKCFCEGDLVKEYVFKYIDYYTNTKLAKIEEKSGDGTKLNSTNIEWGAKGTTQVNNLLSDKYFITTHVDPKIEEYSDNTHTFHYNDRLTKIYYFSGDFNGDGFLDFGYIYNFGIISWDSPITSKYFSYCGTLLNDGNGGFSAPFIQENDTHNSHFGYDYKAYAGDFDYDGKTELNLVEPSYIRSYRLKWNNSTNQWDKNIHDNYPLSSSSTRIYYAGNIAGNGKGQEILFQKEPQHNGTIIHEVVRIKNEEETMYNWFEKWYDYSSMAFAPVPLDFDGDGVMDFIDIFEGKFAIYEYKPNPDTTVCPFQPLYYIPSKILSFTDTINTQWFKVGDFNGDGKTDLIIRVNDDRNLWRTYFSNGKSLLSSATFLVDSDKDLSICDINGDGKDDIILHPSDNQIFVYLSRGDGSFYSEIIPITNYNPLYSDKYTFTFGDFNNDGVNDILFGIEEPHIIYCYKDDLSKQVVSITDGMTRKTQFEYSPLNKVSTKADLEGDIYPLMSPRKVVSKFIELTGLTTAKNDTTITTYRYDKGKIHVTGKGFLGFETVIAKNKKANMSTTTTINLHPSKYVALNTTVMTKTFDERNNIAKQETEFLIREMTNKYHVALLPKKTTSNDYLLHSNNSTVTTATYENQSGGAFYGNPSTVTVDYSGIYTNTTTYTNYSSAGSWCPSKPKNIQITRNQNGQTSGSKTTIVYDDKGRIQKSTTNDYQETGGKPLTRTFTYDNFGNVLTTLAQGKYNEAGQEHTRTSSFQYEPNKGRFLIKATDAAGLVTQYQHEPKFGNKTWEKDPLGNETFYAYDNFGNLTGTQTPIGNGSITRNWIAPVVANLAYTEIITTEGKPTIQTWHDILGREVKSKTNLYNRDSYVIAVYNNDGSVEKTSFPDFTASPSKWKEYKYDEYKRPNTITALGLTTTISYPNGSVKTTYPDGNIETKTHNKAGQTTRVTSSNGTVSYAYNAFGKPDTIKAADIATIMQYDKYGNQIKLIDADAGTTDYHYNAFGELTYQKDANNNAFTLIYNNKGQLTNKNCNNTQFSTTYTYYPTGLPQKEMLGNDNNKEYFYNDKGQLTKFDEKIDGTTYSHQYTYNNRGDVQTYKYPSGYTITNEYNTFGYKTGVKEGSTYIWKVQDTDDYVNEIGQIKKYLLGPNNITTKQEYNGYFELTGINTKTSGNTTLFNYGYLFNHITGNLTSRTDNMRNLTESFGYDDTQTKHRLASWKKNNVIQGSASYQENGNIDTKTDAGFYLYDRNNKPHAVAVVDGFATCAIHHSAQEITYNPFKKTATIYENGNYYTITYGTDGQRKKTVLKNNSAIETIIYSGRYEKLTTGSSTKEFHYIPTPSGTVAVHIKTNGASGTTYFLLKDHLGSIMKVINASGTTIEEHSYDAWGNHRNPANWNLTDFVSTLGINRGYTEHEMLPMFQLINMNGRMYDPVIGRVLSPDNYVQNPTNAQNYNRYSYAMNNPLSYVDPDGEWIEYVIIGVVFIYAMTAHNNASEENKGNPLKWEWNPVNWFRSTPDNPDPAGIVVTVGYTPSGNNFYGSIAVGDMNQPMPAVGYNTSDGFGAGYNYKGRTYMSYPGSNYNASIEAVNKATSQARTTYFANKKFQRNFDAINSSVGYGDCLYGMMLDGTPNVSKAARGFGNGLTGLSIALDGINVYRQYDSGGLNNVNPVDATSLGAGVVGATSKGLSLIGIGGKSVYFIGETAGFVGAAICTFELWWMIYKPMDDLRFAPLHVDKNGEPCYEYFYDTYYYEPYYHYDPNYGPH